MLKDVINHIVSWDHTVWYYMNTQWHNAFLDAFIPYFRNQWFWTPLYVFLAFFMPSKYRRNGLIWCALFLVTFMFSDQISATFLKPIFHRLRPCNNPYLAGIIHVIVPCGSGYSFPSSHAANHFSLGIFMAITLGKMAKWVWPVAISWAVLVSFSQVYVGVHYPLDVVCGGLLGTLIGTCTGWFFTRYFKLTVAPETNSPTFGSGTK